MAVNNNEEYSLNELITSIRTKYDSINLYGNRLEIQRKILLENSKKTIYLDQMSGIKHFIGGWLTPGYITVSFPGSNDRNIGVLDTANDENSIMIGSNQAEEAEIFVKLVEQARSEYIRRQKNNIVIERTEPVSLADEILKLKNLLDIGAIDQEEFESLKKKLIEM